MIYEVAILEEAVADLEVGRGFYGGIDIGAGDYFFDSLLSDISSLWLYGRSHRQVFDYYKMNSKRFPFCIYYGLDDTVVSVVA